MSRSRGASRGDFPSVSSVGSVDTVDLEPIPFSNDPLRNGLNTGSIADAALLEAGERIVASAADALLQQNSSEANPVANDTTEMDTSADSEGTAVGAACGEGAAPGRDSLGPVQGASDGTTPNAGDQPSRAQGLQHVLRYRIAQQLQIHNLPDLSAEELVNIFFNVTKESKYFTVNTVNSSLPLNPTILMVLQAFEFVEGIHFNRWVNDQIIRLTHDGEAKLASAVGFEKKSKGKKRKATSDSTADIDGKKQKLAATFTDDWADVEGPLIPNTSVYHQTGTVNGNKGTLFVTCSIPEGQRMFGRSRGSTGITLNSEARKALRKAEKNLTDFQESLATAIEEKEAIEDVESEEFRNAVAEVDRIRKLRPIIVILITDTEVHVHHQNKGNQSKSEVLRQIMKHSGFLADGFGDKEFPTWVSAGLHRSMNASIQHHTEAEKQAKHDADATAQVVMSPHVKHALIQGIGSGHLPNKERIFEALCCLSDWHAKKLSLPPGHSVLSIMSGGAVDVQQKTKASEVTINTVKRLAPSVIEAAELQVRYNQLEAKVAALETDGKTLAKRVNAETDFACGVPSMKVKVEAIRVLLPEYVKHGGSKLPVNLDLIPNSVLLTYLTTLNASTKPSIVSSKFWGDALKGVSDDLELVPELVKAVIEEELNRKSLEDAKQQREQQALAIEHQRRTRSGRAVKPPERHQ